MYDQMKGLKKMSIAAMVVLSFVGISTHGQDQHPDRLKLWYAQPADNWNEALPIGNGKLAGMIFGGVEKDQIQLNEETIWAGEPGNNIIPEVYDPIVNIRKLLFEGSYQQAQDLANTTFPRQSPPNSNYGMAYQTAGSLWINFKGQKAIKNYRRELDVANAVSAVSYESGGVRYQREYFASLTDSVIIIRLTADQPGHISMVLGVNSPFKDHVIATQPGKLILSGTSSTVDNKKGKVRFQVQVQPEVTGGSIQQTDSTIDIRDANAVVLYISMATNVRNYKDISADEELKASQSLARVKGKPYADLKKSHVETYKKYFDRVSFDLGFSAAARNTTDRRIREFGNGNDPALVALYFQFGRYLLISSSMPGSQPANLQGKWNDKLNPPWDSKYTVNINTEMNYWPAEVTGLPEMHEPLFDLLKDLSVTGQESARKMYHARGWNMHHNTDLWRITGPVDGGFYGMWPMGGAWLSQHLWQHYLYTGDKVFLKDVYPVLKGAALFYADVLQEEPAHKWLVVAPSMSPENTYMKNVGISAGTTMDNQLVFDVFSNVVSAAAILQQDKKLSDTLTGMIKRLPPMQIGQFSQLQEWLMDWDKEQDRHRHVSHLYGLFPGSQISPFLNPELFEAARNTLVIRGDKSTGWSMGWKVNLWARLLDGNRAYKLIADQLSPAPKETQGQNGGTYPNLFDAHPPFQIDGNFGCTSGIAEMLMQSYDGSIHLLPAIPGVWKQGSIKGLIARGGFVVDMSWKNGQISYLKIKSQLGGNCRIRVHGEVEPNLKIASPAKGRNLNPFYRINEIKQPLISGKASLKGLAIARGKLYDVKTSAGASYELIKE